MSPCQQKCILSEFWWTYSMNFMNMSFESIVQEVVRWRSVTCTTLRRQDIRDWNSPASLGGDPRWKNRGAQRSNRSPQRWTRVTNIWLHLGWVTMENTGSKQEIRTSWDSETQENNRETKHPNHNHPVPRLGEGESALRRVKVEGKPQQSLSVWMLAIPAFGKFHNPHRPI
jgi:hypothetical protein